MRGERKAEHLSQNAPAGKVQSTAGETLYMRRKGMENEVNSAILIAMSAQRGSAASSQNEEVRQRR